MKKSPVAAVLRMTSIPVIMAFSAVIILAALAFLVSNSAVMAGM
jgi:hypothetical protein